VFNLVYLNNIGNKRAFEVVIQLNVVIDKNILQCNIMYCQHYILFTVVND